MPVEVRRSEIHGKGVFAKRQIRKGERIGQYRARRTKRDGRYVLWIQDKDDWKGYDGIGRLRFLNHRRDPNAELRERDLYAIRSIKRGEEVTIHYGDEWAHID